MQVVIKGKNAIDDAGVIGLPTNDLVADLTGRTSNIEYTSSAFWGPLEARIEMAGTFEDGYYAAERWLGNPIEIWSPDSTWCWEGIIWTVRFGTGRRRRSRSLEGYASRGTVTYTALSPITYTEITGPPRQIVVGPNTDIDVRPNFTANIGGPWLYEAAQARATAELTRRSRLLWLPEHGSFPQTADAPTIEIDCLGWYRTLSYTSYSSGLRQFKDVALIINEILTGNCPYVSTDRSDMAATTGGAMLNFFDQGETPAELIKRLAFMAGGAFPENEYVFGLGQGRKPSLRLSKRLSTTADYFEHIDGTITDVSGAEIAPWAVRPDTVLRQIDFVPSSTNASAAAIDSIESIYLHSVSYSSRDTSVNYGAAVPGVLGQVSAQ